jgi:hypothetical protein
MSVSEFHIDCDGDQCEYARSGYFRILDFGKYYYPAWKHYGRSVTVACDRCAKSGLHACIGFGQQDLCMICVEELTRDPFESRARYGDPFCDRGMLWD